MHVVDISCVWISSFSHEKESPAVNTKLDAKLCLMPAFALVKGRFPLNACQYFLWGCFCLCLQWKSLLRSTHHRGGSADFFLPRIPQQCHCVYIASRLCSQKKFFRHVCRWLFNYILQCNSDWPSCQLLFLIQVQPSRVLVNILDWIHVGRYSRSFLLTPYSGFTDNLDLLIKLQLSHVVITLQFLFF